jgi:hypothetical protein
MQRNFLIMLALLALVSVAAPVARGEVVRIGGQWVIVPPKQEIPEGAQAWWYVLGVGQNKDEAVEDALNKSADVIADFLRRQDRPFAWTPSKLYIKQHLVKGESQRKQEFDDDLKIDSRPLTGKWYAVPIGITRQDLDQFVRHDREYRQALVDKELKDRSWERMVVVGKVAAFLLAAFVLVIGYLRLEEKTKGYLSRVLGITVVGLLTLLALGLYLCG